MTGALQSPFIYSQSHPPAMVHGMQHNPAGPLCTPTMHQQLQLHCQHTPALATAATTKGSSPTNYPDRAGSPPQVTDSSCDSKSTSRRLDYSTTTVSTSRPAGGKWSGTRLLGTKLAVACGTSNFQFSFNYRSYRACLVS